MPVLTTSGGWHCTDCGAVGGPSPGLLHACTPTGTLQYLHATEGEPLADVVRRLVDAVNELAARVRQLEPRPISASPVPSPEPRVYIPAPTPEPSEGEPSERPEELDS